MAVTCVLTGILLFAGACGVLTDVPAEIRLSVGIAGLVATYFGVDWLAKRRFGVTFQTATWLSAGWLVLVIDAAVLADLLPFAESVDPSKTFKEPVLARPDLFSRHPLGTDRQGLDILGGIVHGFRSSLVVGFGAVALGLAIGGVVGVVAGYYRGRLDRVIEMFTNSMLAFPPLILLLGVAAVLQRNVQNITIALAVITIPTFIRLARANTVVLAQRDSVTASRALGARNRRIVVRDLVPGALLTLSSYAFVVVAVVIVAEASLSFLGLSIPRPQPTLGNMIAAGQETYDKNPHLVFVPATALFLIVFALNRLGEEARKRWDPRESKI
jgi:peptide/nickel transport system permease protein